MIEQFMIAVTTFCYLTAAASNRIALACVFGLAGVPWWFMTAEYPYQWGILAAIGMHAGVWLIALLMKLRRKK